MVSRTRLKPSRAAITLVAACALGALTSACGEAESLDQVEEEGEGDPTLAIQRGQPESAYRAVALMGLEGDPADCTATLVDPSWIVTASHCKDTRAISIGTDASNFQTYPLEPRRYRQMDGTGILSEVHLLKLKTPVRNVPIMPIAQMKLPAPKGGCVAVGFGAYTDPAGATTRGRKRSARLDVVSADEYFVVTREITGHADGGDSGGPLICNGRMVAVVIGGDHIEGERVQRYHPIDPDWIRATIAGSAR